MALNSQFDTLYQAFNKREIETILSAMQLDVQWANGMEGGFVYGRDAVRAYWTRQFESIRPELEVLDIQEDARGRSVVTVRQIVHDMTGTLLMDKTLWHIYTLRDGLIGLFEIDDSNA